MNPVFKQINLFRISASVRHNTADYPLFHHKVVPKNREFMKGLFCFDFVKAMLQRQKPIKLMGGVSSNSEQEQLKKEANQMMEFLKFSMDKFLQHFSALPKLNDRHYNYNFFYHR